MAQYFRRARCRAAPAASRDALPHRRALARLPQPAGARSIALDNFPSAAPEWADAGADEAMALLQEIIVAARNIRAEMKLDPKAQSRRRFLDRQSVPPPARGANMEPILRLATLSELRLSSGASRSRQAPPFARPRNSICASPTATHRQARRNRAPEKGNRPPRERHRLEASAPRRRNFPKQSARESRRRLAGYPRRAPART